MVTAGTPLSPSPIPPLTREPIEPIEASVAGAGYLDFRAASRPDPAFDRARRLNALVPLVPESIVTARPFVISGSEIDRARAVDCLAAAVYYEAGDNERGQRAVAQVVLNRLRHSAFAPTVCAVVFEGSARRTGCQFTFTCDGAMLRHRPGASAWRRARQVATRALHGYAEPAVGYATHYHTDWVYPRWSPTLTKIAAVDSHLFFQMRDISIASFRAPYTGPEPRIAAIASLSPAHAEPSLASNSGDRDTHTRPTPAATSVAGRTVTGGERLPDRARAPDPGIFLVVLDAGAGSEAHLGQALERCGTRPVCKFVGWTNPSSRPARLPMPGSSVDAISFSYTRIGSTDAGTARWNCREFPQADRRLCLQRGS